MTYLIMKYTLVPNTNPRWRAKTRWLPSKVCCLLHHFPNTNFIAEKYGVKPNDKICVFFTRRVSNNPFLWKNHREAYKKFKKNDNKQFSGTFAEYGEWCRAKFQRDNWNKEKKSVLFGEMEAGQATDNKPNI